MRRIWILMDQRIYPRCPASPAYAWSQGRWGRGENRGRPAVPENGEKPARRELPGHRVPREPPDRWDREEIPVNVDLPGRPAIHKIISLHLTQGRIW